MFRPDVSLRRMSEPKFATDGGVSIVDMEPVSLSTPKLELESVGYIEIRNITSAHIITVIEVLSPSDKREPNLSDYRLKIVAFRQAGVHVIEIDLLLVGIGPETIEPLPAGDYFASVSRREKYPASDVYAWSIRRKLPTIRIPLNSPDPDVIVNLDEVFKVTLERGGYARRIRYDTRLIGEISPADLQWAHTIVAESLPRR